MKYLFEPRKVFDLMNTNKCVFLDREKIRVSYEGKNKMDTLTGLE